MMKFNFLCLRAKREDKGGALNTSHWDHQERPVVSSGCLATGVSRLPVEPLNFSPRRAMGLLQTPAGISGRGDITHAAPPRTRRSRRRRSRGERLMRIRSSRLSLTEGVGGGFSPRVSWEGKRLGKKWPEARRLRSATVVGISAARKRDNGPLKGGGSRCALMERSLAGLMVSDTVAAVTKAARWNQIEPLDSVGTNQAFLLLSPLIHHLASK